MSKVRVASLLIWSIFLLSTVYARCVDVARTSICSDYVKAGQTAMIETDNLVSATSITDDVATFDAWVQSSRGVVWELLNCGAVMDTRAMYRYSLSAACQQAFNATSSATCSGVDANTIPKLCKATCTEFVQSIVNGGFTTTLCKSSPEDQTQWRDEQNRMCAALNDEPQCVSAVALERDNCGFGSSDQARLFCTENPASPCCLLNPDLLKPETRLDRLPMIAGICGGCFFGVIAIAFSLIQYYEAKHRGSDLAPPTTVHAHRAERGARSSQLWNDGLPASQASGSKQGPQHVSVDFDYGQSQAPDVQRPAAAAANSSVSTRRPSRSSTAGAPRKSLGRMPSRHSMRSDSYTAPRDRSSMGFYRAIVVEGYDPLEPDEVVLQTGDVVHVQRVFDDGWGWGTNTSTGQEGAFPVVCLSTF